YYAIGATVVAGVDPWGNLINNTSPDPGNNGQVTWNVENGNWSGSANGPMVKGGSGYEFSRVGAYTPGATDPDDTSDGGARATTTDSIYSAPNMGYNIAPVPEPASLALAGLGAILSLARMRSRKSSK
ncbi:MAG: PEP-CTERM sorting domain-containing protein, partial [Limisphaerales bacterium]